MVDWTTVKGKKSDHKVALYALSTCGWCKKTKRLLDALEVDYEYVYVDKLTGEDKEQVRVEVKAHNPSGSYPTIVVDDGAEVIVGFQESKIRETLDK